VMAAAAAKPAYSAVADKEVELVIDRKAEDVRRSEILTALADMENFDPGQDPRAFHGRAFSALLGEAELPKTVWKSEEKPRKNSPDWLTASEYLDQPEVLQKKVKLLATLLKASHRTLAYTGAGLSVRQGLEWQLLDPKVGLAQEWV